MSNGWNDLIMVVTIILIVGFFISLLPLYFFWKTFKQFNIFPNSINLNINTKIIISKLIFSFFFIWLFMNLYIKLITWSDTRNISKIQEENTD